MTALRFWCQDDILQQEDFLDSALAKQTPWLWHWACSARAASEEACALTNCSSARLQLAVRSRLGFGALGQAAVVQHVELPCTAISTTHFVHAATSHMSKFSVATALPAELHNVIVAADACRDCTTPRCPGTLVTRYSTHCCCR